MSGSTHPHSQLGILNRVNRLRTPMVMMMCSLPSVASASDGLLKISGMQNRYSGETSYPFQERYDQSKVESVATVKIVDWKSLIRALNVSLESELRDGARRILVRAIDISSKLQMGGLDFPRLTREDDGEIDFVWKSKTRYTSLSVTGDGNIVGYDARNGSDVFRMDEPFSYALLALFHARATMI